LQPAQDAWSLVWYFPGWHFWHRTPVIPYPVPHFEIVQRLVIVLLAETQAAVDHADAFAPLEQVASQEVFPAALVVEPLPHAVHKVDLFLSLYEPMTHEVHDVDLSALLYVPALQSVHDVAPSDVLYVPAAQDVQEVEPAEVLYVPAAHKAHEVDLLALLYVPALQSVHDVAPSDVLYVPAAQDVHDVCVFSVFVNVPAAHCAHVCPST
jgi:hypothetical protein